MNIPIWNVKAWSRWRIQKNMNLMVIIHLFLNAFYFFWKKIKLVIHIAWFVLIFRPSFGVFSCKTIVRSKVWRIKFTEGRTTSELSTSCWFWFGCWSLCCSWCRIWCRRLCTGEYILNVSLYSFVYILSYKGNIYVHNISSDTCSVTVMI